MYGVRSEHLIIFCMPTTLCLVVMATPKASLRGSVKQPPEVESLATAVLQERRSLKQRQ